MKKLLATIDELHLDEHFAEPDATTPKLRISSKIMTKLGIDSAEDATAEAIEAEMHALSCESQLTVGTEHRKS